MRRSTDERTAVNLRHTSGRPEAQTVRLSLPAVHRTDGAADEWSFRTYHRNFPVLHARQMRESGHGRHTDNDVADLGRMNGGSGNEQLRKF